MKSASVASEVPPGLNARKRTSSSLNVVGFSTTFTPFDSSHSVMPNALRVAVRTTVPRAGVVSSSADVPTLSTYGSSVFVSATVITAASVGLVGHDDAVGCGALTSTTRLPSGVHSRARLLISPSVISGRNRWCSAYSYAMPGIGSRCVKLRMYSAASAADCWLSFSVSACS